MPTLGGVILVDPVSGEPYKAATTAEVASQMADPSSELGAALSSTYVTRAAGDVARSWLDAQTSAGVGVISATGTQTPTAGTDAAPHAGTLDVLSTQSAAISLRVRAAWDDKALHATPYRFSKDGGATYSAWQASPLYTGTGLISETIYSCVHQVRDAAGTVTTGTAVPATTQALAMLARWEASTAAGVGVGGNVTTWTDSVASIALAATAPAGITYQNSVRPTLRFLANGIKKLTSVSTGLTVPNPLTMAAVVKLNETSVTKRMIMGDTTKAVVHVGTWTESKWSVYAGTAVALPAPAPDTNWHVVVVTTNADGSGTFYLDGTAYPYTGAGGNQGIVNTFEIGSNPAGDSSVAADISEVRIYGTALSPADAAAITASLKTKYGL